MNTNNTAIIKASDFMNCSNHQNNLHVQHILVVAGNVSGNKIALLNDMYCVALFLRMGGHFVRLVTATPEFSRNVHIADCEPPPEAAQFAQELSGMILESYAREHDASAAARKEKQKQLDSFFSVLNCKLWDDSPTIYLDGRTDRMVLIDTLCEGILKVVLPQLPPVPSAGKWAKLYPSLRLLTPFGTTKKSTNNVPLLDGFVCVGARVGTS